MIEKVRLGELCRIQGGYAFKSNQFQKNNIPIIRIGNIQENKVLIDNDICYTKEFLNSHPEFEIKNGDLLIAMSGATVGKVGIYSSKESALLNQRVGKFVITDKIESRYLYFLLLSPLFEKFILNNAFGCAQPNISNKQIEKFRFYKYSIEKQREIANKLDKVQEIIGLRKKQKEELDKLIKLQFVEMFGTIYDNKNNYKIKQLKEVFSIIKDGTHSTPTYTEDKINGIKFLSAKDVASGTINWNNIKYIPADLHNELSKRVKPQKNDILLAKNGTTGICAKVDKDEVFDIYVSLALLRANEGYSIDYLVQAINNDMTKEQFDRSLKGVGVPNLHLGEIEKTKIIVPPIELQNQFAEIVKQINKQKFIIEKTLKETEELQESLMNKYFN